MILFKSRFLLLVTVIVAARAASVSEVISLNSSNFDDVVLHSGKMTFLNLYLGYSGHCKAFHQTFEELASLFSPVKEKLQFARLDLFRQEEVLHRFLPNPGYDIINFPSMRLFEGGSYASDGFEHLDYLRSIEVLAAYITVKTGLQPKRDVLTLTDRTFADVVGGPKNVLVAYINSRCQCMFHLPLTTWMMLLEALTGTSFELQKAAPYVESLAAEFTLYLPLNISRNIVIAEVVTDSPSSQMISAFGTKYPIKWYPAGSKESEDYLGQASAQGLIKFVDERAGHPEERGLENADQDVGTIPKLDAILAKIPDRGGKLESVIDELNAHTAKCWPGFLHEDDDKYGRIANDLLLRSLPQRHEYILTERRRSSHYFKAQHGGTPWYKSKNILTRYARALGIPDNE